MRLGYSVLLIAYVAYRDSTTLCMLILDLLDLSASQLL